MSWSFVFLTAPFDVFVVDGLAVGEDVLCVVHDVGTVHWPGDVYSILDSDLDFACLDDVGVAWEGQEEQGDEGELQWGVHVHGVGFFGTCAVLWFNGNGSGNGNGNANRKSIDQGCMLLYF